MICQGFDHTEIHKVLLASAAVHWGSPLHLLVRLCCVLSVSPCATPETPAQVES